MFEVELRALITEDQYNSLREKFDAAVKGDVDDAETYTFLTKDINIKVKNRTTKKKAKITLKKGAEYRQQAEERELEIDPSQVQNAVALITALGFQKHIPSLQKRIDYKIDGMSISLKHETNWKYHVEAEIVVDAKEKVADAKKRLHQFFKDHELKPMTEEQTRTLINSILKKYEIDLI